MDTVANAEPTLGAEADEVDAGEEDTSINEFMSEGDAINCWRCSDATKSGNACTKASIDSALVAAWSPEGTRMPAKKNKPVRKAE